MDTHGKGELSVEDVRAGFERVESNRRTAAEALSSEIGPVLRRVEHAMKGMRLPDFFAQLDVHKRKEISSEDLKRGLEQLLQVCSLFP